MKIIKWGLAAIGLFVIGGVIAFGVLSAGGTASAQTPEQQSQARLEQYESLLAQKLGISVQTLQDAETGARNQMIDDALASGKITQAQADKLRSMPPGAFRAGRLDGMKNRVHNALVNVFNAAAKTIGISNDDLKTQVQSGQSLAQVANAHNMTTDQLKTGITTEITAQLKAGVDSGKITQPEADQILSRLTGNLDNIVNHTGGKADIQKMQHSR